MVEAEGELSVKDLLRILGTALLAGVADGREEARGAGGLDAFVEGVDVGGHRAATRHAHRADAFGVDIRPFAKDIDRAHRVPDAVLGLSFAEKVGAYAGVLVSVAADERPSSLEALALVGGVDYERRETGERALHAAPLVAGAGLALGGMAAGNEDAGIRRLEGG